MVRVLHDEHESYEVCQERLLAYERERFARDNSSSLDELEARIERTLTDQKYVNGERHHWTYR